MEKRKRFLEDLDLKEIHPADHLEQWAWTSNATALEHTDRIFVLLCSEDFVNYLENRNKF
jgi:hypothetical protein